MARMIVLGSASDARENDSTVINCCCVGRGAVPGTRLGYGPRYRPGDHCGPGPCPGLRVADSARERGQSIPAASLYCCTDSTLAPCLYHFLHLATSLLRGRLDNL